MDSLSIKLCVTNRSVVNCSTRLRDSVVSSRGAIPMEPRRHRKIGDAIRACVSTYVHMPWPGLGWASRGRRSATERSASPSVHDASVRVASCLLEPSASYLVTRSVTQARYCAQRTPVGE